LLGFPDAGNCSDHATWLGETKLLAELGLPITCRASAQSYQRASLAAKIGEGTILLHGGYFGGHSLDREFQLRVLQDFSNRTIFLPQHVSSGDRDVERVTTVIAKHPDVTLFAASGAAREMFGRYLGAKQRVEMAPDAAFLLGRQARPREPLYDILWLARTDRRQKNNQAEVAARLLSQAAEKSVLPRFSDGIEISLVVKQRPPTVMLTDWSSLVFENQEARLAYHSLDFDARAQAFVDRALYILSLGRIVITDRLRAHILCLLLGIPHILIDDDSGKNRDFYESWSSATNLCLLAANPAEAWTLARNALPKLKEGSNPDWLW